MELRRLVPPTRALFWSVLATSSACSLRSSEHQAVVLSLEDAVCAHLATNRGYRVVAPGQALSKQKSLPGRWGCQVAFTCYVVPSFPHRGVPKTPQLLVGLIAGNSRAVSQAACQPTRNLFEGRTRVVQWRCQFRDDKQEDAQSGGLFFEIVGLDHVESQSASVPLRIEVIGLSSLDCGESRPCEEESLCHVLVDAVALQSGMR